MQVERFDDELIKIENLKGILAHFKPMLYHPDDPRWTSSNRVLKKKMIEGIWVEQFGKFRYVTGRIGFFGVFFRFTDWNKDTKERVYNVQPNVRDLEWHRANYRLEASGFSGWDNDPNYTSDNHIFDIKKNFVAKISPLREKHLYKADGTFKEYIPPRENIFMLHDSNELGLPLYYNNAKNQTEIGARGGGKSYWTAGGELLFDLIFDNLKRYEIGKKYTSKAELEVTSAQGGDAYELLKKVQEGMDYLKDPLNTELGVFIYNNGKVEPCYFYKHFEGSIKGNNKDNPWSHTRKSKIEGGQGFETKKKSYVINTTYSVNSKGGALKSAGGRRTFVLHEEAGKNVLLLDAWGNNEGMVSDSGVKLATQKAIGTSGDLETVEPIRQIFTHADIYNCLTYKYRSDPKVKHGWFLSVAMVDSRFKDENGNTDLEAAKAYHENVIKEMEAAGASSDVLLNYKMNNPLEIDDMWFGGGASVMPVQEAKINERRLLKGNLYESVGTKIKFKWDNTHETGVSYDLNPTGVPFYQFPVPTTIKNLEGTYVMYVHPDKLKINGVIPNDAVLTMVDPYVADEWNRGESLGCILHFCNPKYLVYGLPGGKLLASYHGKPIKGTDEFANMTIQGHAFYGGCTRTLWYENNKGGEKIRSAALRHKKHHFLCLEPQYENGHSIFVSNSKKTGYYVGGSSTNKESLSKRVLWGNLAELLVTPLELKTNGDIITTNVLEQIDDLYLTRQIIHARMDLNVDAVSAMQALPLSLVEQEHRETNNNSRRNLIGIANTLNKLRKDKIRRRNPYQRHLYDD